MAFSYHRDDGTKVPSWNDYCESIGITKRAANNKPKIIIKLLKKFFEALSIDSGALFI